MRLSWIRETVTIALVGLLSFFVTLGVIYRLITPFGTRQMRGAISSRVMGIR